MRAYEFYAEPKDGVIPIPEKYRSQISDYVMVIVLEKTPYKFNSNETITKKKSDLSLPPTLDTRDWEFDREETNPQSKEINETEKQDCLKWLSNIKKSLELSRNEDLSNFPKQGMMKIFYDDWFD